MRILALITARSGSKRVPGKNIRKLGSKALVIWSIDVVENNKYICDILVSTDDKKIADICKNANASVPWLRPINLASDTANSVDVALHALEWYESEKGPVDGLLLLQPTSPFRTKYTIQNGIDLFVKYQHKSVIGVSAVNKHPLWMLKIEKDNLIPFMHNHSLNLRSQDLPEVYIPNGSFYLISPKELRMHRSFINPETKALIIESPEESLDIDTEWDFKIAEFLADNPCSLKKLN